MPGWYVEVWPLQILGWLANSKTGAAGKCQQISPHAFRRSHCFIYYPPKARICAGTKANVLKLLELIWASKMKFRLPNMSDSYSM